MIDIECLGTRGYEYVGGKVFCFPTPDGMRTDVSLRALEDYSDWKGQEVDVVVKLSSIKGHGILVMQPVRRSGGIVEYTGDRYDGTLEDKMAIENKEMGIKGVYTISHGDLSSIHRGEVVRKVF